MMDSTAERKDQALRTMANEYARRGFRVLVHPDHAARAVFFNALDVDFAPDLLALGDEEKVVGLVRLREELIDNVAFVRLAEAIDAAPGWRLDLEVVPPVTPPIAPPTARELTTQDIRTRIVAARQLSAQGDQESALLVVWSALESSLRQLVEEYDTTIDRPQPIALLQQAAWLGLLGQDDFARLQQALRYRNNAAHGFRATEVTAAVVEEVIAQIEGLQQPDPHHAIA